MAQQTIQIADKPTLNNVNETTLSMLQMLSSYDCEVSTLPYDFEGGSAVVLDGVIHILSGFGNNRAHYRYDGPKYGWVSISTLPDDLVYSAVVFEDKIHIFGGTTHYRYDGAEYGWVSVSTLPYDFEGGSVVVLENEIHILGGYGDNTAHYKFDGTTWTSVSTLPYKLTYYYKLNPAVTLSCCGSAVVLNNEIHILGGLKKVSQGVITIAEYHYKWNGTEWSEVSTLPQGYSEYSAVVFNNEIYIFCDDKKYKWNGTEWSEALSLPCTVSQSSAVVLNNQIHLLGGEYNTNSHYALVLNTSSLNDIYTLLSTVHKNIDTLDVNVDNKEVLNELGNITSLLENSTYGLSAIKSLLDTHGADIKWLLQNTDFGLEVIRSCVGDTLFLVQHSDYGLSAIKTAVANLMPRYKPVACYSLSSTENVAQRSQYIFTGKGKLLMIPQINTETGYATITSLDVDKIANHVSNLPIHIAAGSSVYCGATAFPLTIEYDSHCDIIFYLFNTSIIIYHYQYVTA